MRRRLSSSGRSSGLGRAFSSSYMSAEDSPAEHQQRTPELSEGTSGHVPSSHASEDPSGSHVRIPSDPRVELRLDGSEIYTTDRSQIAQKITSCIKSHYTDCYPNWSNTPNDVRELWFEEFKKLCWWEPVLDGGIRRAFNKIAATRLSDTMVDARKAWNAKKRQPTWISDTVWQELLNFWASSDSFKKLSEAGKKNRAAENSGFRPSLHIGGSRSFRDHARAMEAEKGEEVIPSELFLKTHQKATGEFVCSKAQNVYERFSSLRPTASEGQAGGSFSQPIEADLWREATGGPRKGRLYGFGSQQQAQVLGVNLFPQSPPSVESRARPHSTQQLGESSSQSMSIQAVHVLVNNLISSVVLQFDERLSSTLQGHGISAPIEPTTWMQQLPPELRPFVAPPASTPAPLAFTPASEDNESDDEEQNT